MKALSVYIHIPFCVQKCFYCDFLSAPAEEAEKKQYIKALLQEIEQESTNYVNYQVETVFIGGGTPSSIDEEDIGEILCKLRKCFHFITDDEQQEQAEITIEINPGTVSGEKLEKYRKWGINRLSIGMQSANDRELKMLGRIHNWNEFMQTYESARQVGFTNINIDIMSALPEQSQTSYKETLQKVIALNPEHISAYSLIIEEDTPFYEWFSQGMKKEHLLPSEEQERQMYELTGTLLQKQNYTRYEISNYARPGCECRHNTVYWQRGDYVGFGLGAASMIENTRWNNTKNIQNYLVPQNPIKENHQQLTQKEQMEEFMFLGLRLTEGISREKFYQCFDQTIEEIYGPILTKLEQEKLIKTDNHIHLTPYGMDISNYVMSQFLF